MKLFPSQITGILVYPYLEAKTLSSLLTPSWWGMGKNLRVQARKSTDWNKPGLIGKAKVLGMCVSEGKQRILCFPLAVRSSAISRKAGLYHMYQLLRRTNAIAFNVSPLFLQFLLLTMTSYSMETLWG